MHKIAFVVMIAGSLAFGACSKKEEQKKPETTGGGGVQLNAAAEFEKISEQMCKCKDEKCAELVMKDMKAFGEKNKDTKLAEKDQARVNAAASRLIECQSKLTAAAQPPEATPPPAKPDQPQPDKQ